MIALRVAKLKMFSLNKAKKRKTIFLWKVWINTDVYEVCEKARNVFCDEPTSV